MSKIRKIRFPGRTLSPNSELKRKKNGFIRCLEEGVTENIADDVRERILNYATGYINGYSVMKIRNLYKTMDQTLKEACEERFGDKAVWEEIKEAVNNFDILKPIPNNIIGDAINKCISKVCPNAGPPPPKDPEDIMLEEFVGANEFFPYVKMDEMYFKDIHEDIKKNVDMAALRTTVIVALDKYIEKIKKLDKIENIILKNIKNAPCKADIKEFIVENTEKLIAEDTEKFITEDMDETMENIQKSVMKYVRDKGYTEKIENKIESEVANFVTENHTKVFVGYNEKLINESVKSAFIEASKKAFVARFTAART